MEENNTVQSYHEGACVYRGDGSLDYILHPEGVVRATGQGLSHEYFLRDHLGNTRVVFGSNGAVLQATDYYAFGLEHTPKAKENENRYLYNGKELQDETFAGGVRLGWYDYGAKFYDPTIGRWHSIDPLAEVYSDMSPYNYAANNPILFIDPDGMKVVNGHEAEKKKAEEEKKKAEERYNAADKGKGKKEWKAAKNELRQKTRAYNKADRNYQNAQAAIDALKEVAPDIFNELDNLQGPQGQNIDISVTTLESNASYWKDGEEYELRGGTYAVPGSGSFNSYIKDPVSGANNTIGVKLKLGVGALILAHEGGHCVYYSKNVRE